MSVAKRVSTPEQLVALGKVTEAQQQYERAAELFHATGRKRRAAILNALREGASVPVVAERGKVSIRQIHRLARKAEKEQRDG